MIPINEKKEMVGSFVWRFVDTFRPFGIGSYVFFFFSFFILYV
jgi:hypothetical protein